MSILLMTKNIIKCYPASSTRLSPLFIYKQHRQCITTTTTQIVPKLLSTAKSHANNSPFLVIVPRHCPTSITSMQTHTDSILNSGESEMNSSSMVGDNNLPYSSNDTLCSNNSPSTINTFGNGNHNHKKLVLVIAGPTASGKSDVATKLCNLIQGLIISADSVQAYTGVQIGANKPTLDEQAQMPHLLLDIVSNPATTYNAAEWTRDCLYTIRKLCGINNHDTELFGEVSTEPETVSIQHLDDEINRARATKGYNENKTIVPVVVGGTMMYIQWLVYGRPDALQPTHDALTKAATDVEQFMIKQDWYGAVEYVKSMGSIYEQQVIKFSTSDWYRLRRVLEVAYTIIEKNDPTLIQKSYTGIRQGGIVSDPEYDVRCFFLCPDDRMSHSRIVDNRCEDMILRGLITETTNLLVSDTLPDMASKAIGYRQTLDYIQRSTPEFHDEATFLDYVGKFAAATRQYSKRQMQWFRRDSNFYFIPVPVTTISNKNDRVNTVVTEIMRLAQLPRTEFEKELSAEDGLSTITRKTNEQQGKTMKTYQFRIEKLKSTNLKSALLEADDCTRRVGQSSSTEQPSNRHEKLDLFGLRLGRKRPVDESNTNR